MAANVSTISSVCLYCKTNSATDAEKDFHEIYDEVGLELQLPTLVETFFHIKVKNDGKKYLCNDCVNHLIELYDLDEHAKEEGIEAPQLERLKNINDEADSIIKAEGISKERSGICLKEKICQLAGTPASHSTKEKSQVTQQNTNTIGYENLKIFPLTPETDIKRVNEQSGTEDKIDDLEYEDIETVEDLIDQDKTSTFTLTHLQVGDDIAENFPEEEFVTISENEEPQDLNESTSNSIIEATEVTNPSETEFSEHIELIEDDADVSMEVENMVDANTFKGNEERDFIKSRRINDYLFSEADNGTTVNNSNNQNDFMEDNAYEEELDEILVDNYKNHSQTENKQKLDMENIYIEESDDIYCEENSAMHEMHEKDGVKVVGNANTSEEETTNIIAIHYDEMEARFVNTDDIDTEEIIVIEQDEVSNDIPLEEEYLIEEITFSEEYDNVDVNEYLDKVLLTKFQDLQLNWETECKFCLEKYNTIEDLLKHSCITEFEEEKQFCCIIKDCDENMNNLPTLARHLIINHYDKLESVAIYGKCPDCQKSFSNIMDLNKHSCCRNIKRKPGSPNYCQYCDMDFQSLKRYVFHMQFHLTNRRPKVCLLCGNLFNNSNDFFEHTQYQHIPKTAMACINCDRFFVKKEVFYTHMELHEDSKYQYSCTLCPKKYTNKFVLNQHMDIYHNNKSNALQCSHCEKEFLSKSSYRNHIKCHANDVQVESFICSTCGIITNNSEFIKYHIESDEGSHCFSSPIEEKSLSLGYTCENCSLDFHTIKQLKIHRLSESHSDDLFHCGICRQSFKSLRHMRNHSVNHKDFKEWQAAFPITRYFVCNIADCQEFYPIWTSLYYHKKRPHKSEESTISPNKFKCQFCQQLCLSKMSLAVHVARSHNNSNIKCSHCKRGFKYQKLLQEHIDRYHTPVECEICFKKFKHSRNLESHNNMVHLNIKRFFCKHCEKGYFYKSEKDIHEKKVHPEVAYKCEICNFTTNYPESLEIHMDKHNNQLKFQCTICGREFGRKQLLKAHLKRHVNKKDYCCDKYLNGNGCDEKFVSYHLLKRHIQIKHPNSSFSINMQRDEQNKKPLNKLSESDQIENISYEILDCDDGSMSETSHLNDTEFERDAIELVLEDDVEFDEQ